MSHGLPDDGISFFSHRILFLVENSSVNDYQVFSLMFFTSILFFTWLMHIEYVSVPSRLHLCVTALLNSSLGQKVIQTYSFSI